MQAILIPISFFIFIFAIVYLYFTTRNKERMALIEKGAEASIFFSEMKNKGPSIGKIIILNLALVLICIGAAIFIAALLEEIGLDGDIAYPGCIFIMGGVGLLTGFFITKKMEDEH